MEHVYNALGDCGICAAMPCHAVTIQYTYCFRSYSTGCFAFDNFAYQAFFSHQLFIRNSSNQCLICCNTHYFKSFCNRNASKVVDLFCSPISHLHPPRGCWDSSAGAQGEHQAAPGGGGREEAWGAPWLPYSTRDWRKASQAQCFFTCCPLAKNHSLSSWT